MGTTLLSKESSLEDTPIPDEDRKKNTTTSAARAPHRRAQSQISDNSRRRLCAWPAPHREPPGCQRQECGYRLPSPACANCVVPPHDRVCVEIRCSRENDSHK